MSLQLKQVQHLLYRLITAPGGVAEGLAEERALPAGGIAEIISGDERVSAEDRVDIYANMYFYRLLEVFREDYPATATVLGDTNFHNLITGYLIEYRPTGPSVTWAGKSLADYLRDHPLLAQFPFVADLAMLERATVDVFCAADAAVLESSEMNAVPPEQWAAVRMRRIPATALLTAEWGVAAVLRAVEEKRDWSVPERHPNRIFVWRRHSRVAFREVADREAEALTMLSRTVRFGRVCEVMARDLSDADAPAEISSTLARWLQDGILVRESARTR